MLPLLAILLRTGWRVPVTVVVVLIALGLGGDGPAPASAVGRRGAAVAGVVVGGAAAMMVTFAIGQLVGATGI